MWSSKMVKNLSSYEGRMPHPQMKVQATQECSPNSLDYMFECALNKSLSLIVCRNKSHSNLKTNKQINQQSYQKYPSFAKIINTIQHMLNPSVEGNFLPCKQVRLLVLTRHFGRRR